jgi:CDGSH-type Zn-finger protein
MRQRTKVLMTTDGPLLIQGEIDLFLPDGTIIHPQRRTIALCLCNRSLAWPFCDTSHRKGHRGTARTQAMISHSAGNVLRVEDGV